MNYSHNFWTQFSNFLTYGISLRVTNDFCSYPDIQYWMNNITFITSGFPKKRKKHYNLVILNTDLISNIFKHTFDFSWPILNKKEHPTEKQ